MDKWRTQNCRPCRVTCLSPRRHVRATASESEAIGANSLARHRQREDLTTSRAPAWWGRGDRSERSTKYERGDAFFTRAPTLVPSGERR